MAINFRAIASNTEIVLDIAESVRVITETVIVITDSVLIIIESVLLIKDCSSHNAYLLVQTCHITHPVSCTLIIQSAQNLTNSTDLTKISFIKTLSGHFKCDLLNLT